MTYDEFIQQIINTRGRFGIPKGEYHERHHILPKCMGGTNDKDNLVDLTAQEHYNAHKLLAEENPNVQGLLYARHMMTLGGGSSKKRIIQNDEEYAEARKKYAEYLTKYNSGKNNPIYGVVRITGPDNPMFGTNRKGENGPWFGKERDSNTKENFCYSGCKRIFQEDIDGNILYIYKSAAEASRVTGINYVCIKDVAGHRNGCITAGGYKWEYDPDYIPFKGNIKKPVAQIDLEGNVVAVYDSITEASRKTGIDKNSISHVCSGIQKRKTAGGFKWRFLKDENE